MSEQHTEAIADIRRTVGRLKTLLDNADLERPYAAQALYNANAQLTRIQGELARLEMTLQQYITPEQAAAKVGPSETKV